MTEPLETPPTLIAGKYQLVRLVGRGGMGEVWEGRHVQLGKRVAIKFIDRQFASHRELVQRFEREALAAAAIRSRYIVDIYDVGATDSGQPYMVMEFLNGESLGARLDHTTRLSPLETAKIVNDVGRALQLVHSRGIVHRDLKPENIQLVTDEDGAEYPKLLDFGIAKFIQPPELEPSISSTRTGTIIGTPYYMSPEQAMGSRLIDHRTDLWSLGVIVYRCIVGRLPFDGDSFGEILMGLMQKSAPRPSGLAAVPAGFDDFIARALSRDPDARFQRAEELANALASICNLPVSQHRAADAKPHAPRDTHSTTGAWTHTRPDASGLHEAAAAPTARGWNAVRSAISEDLSTHAECIVQFLRTLFDEGQPLDARPNLVRLSKPQFRGDASMDFLALFLGSGSRGDRRVQTRTFLEYADPLEAHLRELPTDSRKVVIAIVDSLELGAGVHGKIFEFNQKYSAIVLPFHVGDLATAVDEERELELFQARLADFHVFPDVFGGSAHDSVALYGHRVSINSLIDTFTKTTPFVIAYGPPGSGKTALLQTVRGEVSNTRFFAVQCDLSADALPMLVRQMEQAFSGPWSDGPPTGDFDGLGAKIGALTHHLKTQGKRAAVILDDCDWLIRGAVDAPASADQLLVRRLLGFLVEQTSNRRLGVVLVATTGFLLRRGEIGSWHNPVAKHARWIELQPLALLDLERMLRDLGAQINVAFDAAAIQELHRLSAGNVHVVRALCREMVVPMRRKTNLSPLHQLRVTKKEVAQAARALAGMPDTFSDRMVSCLTPLEQRVLRVVAELRPRTIQRITAAMGDNASHDDCREALERLHRIGFVDWEDDHAQVAMPVFRDWIKRHIELPFAHRERRRWQRVRWLALGASCSAFVVGGYYILTKNQTIQWASNGCSYLLHAPERALPDEKIALRAVRACKQDKTPDAIFLRPGVSTSVRFSNRGTTADAEMYKLGGGRDDWQNEELFATFQDVSQDKFVLNVAITPVREVVIKKDWIGRLPKFADSVLALIGALPTVLGAFLAFHREVLKGFRGLLPGNARTDRSEPPG